MKRHIESVHEKKTKPHKCSSCDRSFRDKCYLKKHVESVHEETTFNNLEKIEELGIFVKSETNIKPEIIFGISKSDSEGVMSTMSSDPLDITDHGQE